MKKQVLSGIIALLMLITLVPSMSFALPEGVPTTLSAPKIEGIELKKDDDGVPYILMQVYIPQGIIALDMSKPAGGSVFWDYSEKIDNGGWSEFGGGGYLDVIYNSEEAIVPGKQNVFYVRFDVLDEGGIDEVKIKNHLYSYKLKFYFDYYEGWPNVEPINSPESNTLSIGSGAFYSDASGWAKNGLEKAQAYGLIPDILSGADMTQPITREEFAELGIKLYESVTGTSVTPVSPNPFTDTTNPEVLKAFAVGITKGMSPTTFEPNKLITREECATMLFNCIKAINPDGDYSTTGVKDFPDQKNIAAWAHTATKYMFKTGIIKGDNQGNFMPKGLTQAQKAKQYGMATREAAILMAVATYENFK